MVLLLYVGTTCRMEIHEYHSGGSGPVLIRRRVSEGMDRWDYDPIGVYKLLKKYLHFQLFFLYNCL